VVEISVCPPSSPEVRCTVLQSLGLPLEAPLTRIGIPEILCKLQFRYNYCVHVWGQITGLSKGDALALSYTIHAAKVLDHIFLEQEWRTNPALKLWLEKQAEKSELDRLKFAYYLINKSPWYPAISYLEICTFWFHDQE
jgi:hypothetical protein